MAMDSPWTVLGSLGSQGPWGPWGPGPQKAHRLLYKLTAPILYKLTAPTLYKLAAPGCNAKQNEKQNVRGAITSIIKQNTKLNNGSITAPKQNEKQNNAETELVTCMLCLAWPLRNQTKFNKNKTLNKNSPENEQNNV